jgi:hypothetical protein
MELKPEEKEMHIQTVEVLKGSARRMYMARVVNMWGRGGQAQAERELGWNRHTIRKGQRELVTGHIEDNFAARGRKRAEEHLPNLLADMRTIADGQSQTDPTFQSQRLSRPKQSASNLSSNTGTRTRNCRAKRQSV